MDTTQNINLSSEPNPISPMFIDAEFSAWENYLKKILEEYANPYIYLKGGSVLGLECLRRIVTECGSDDDIFEKIYTDFKDMELIKDWDFLFEHDFDDDGYCDIDDLYYLDKNFKNEGTTYLIVMRYLTEDQRLMIDDKALFEMIVNNKKKELSELEIPLTSMKIQITNNNLSDLFILIKLLYPYRARTHFDRSGLHTPTIKITLNYLQSLFDKCVIEIDPYTDNGLFKIGSGIFQIDEANLSPQMLNIMKNIDNIHAYQFLISQFNEPDRFFMRLPKNIAKSEKIKHFFNTHQIMIPDWLIDKIYVEKIKMNFMAELKLEINDIYDSYLSELNPLYLADNYLERNKHIISIKIDLLKYNDSYTNMIEILTQNLETNFYPDIIRSTIIDNIMKYSSIDQIRSIIILLSEKKYLCNKYGVDENIIFIDDMISRKKEIYNLTKEKFSGINIDLEKEASKIKFIYAEIFIKLNDLFRGINIGRLTTLFTTLPNPMKNEIINLFENIIKDIRLPYLNHHPPQETYIKMINFIKKIMSFSKIKIEI